MTVHYKHGSASIVCYLTLTHTKKACEQAPGWVWCELAEYGVGRAGGTESSLVTRGSSFRAKRLALGGKPVRGVTSRNKQMKIFKKRSPVSEELNKFSLLLKGSVS